MNSLQVKNFLAVVKYGSFSKAAEELNIAQPTLSKSISSLEKELSIKLFNRNYHNLSLTMPGNRLYEFFSNAEEEFNTILEDICPKKRIKDTLRIGLLREVKTTSLNRSIHDFRNAHPELEISIYLYSVGQIMGEFQKDKFDLMILFEMTPGLGSQYEKVVLEEVPMMLFYSNIYHEEPNLDSFRDECYLYVSHLEGDNEEFSMNIQKAFWDILGFIPKQQKSEDSFQALQLDLASGTGYWIGTKTNENTYLKDISGIELDGKTNFIAVCKTEKNKKYLEELKKIYRQNITEE